MAIRSKGIMVMALTGVAMVPALMGCPSAVNDVTGSVCCTDFKAGTDMSTATFNLDGNAAGTFRAFAQAAGDLAATSASIENDIQGACQALALDFGADPKDPGVQNVTGTNAVTAWCHLAAVKIAAATAASGDLAAAGTLTVTFSPPQCAVEANFQAKCEGSCQVDASCTEPDVTARCDPGQLSGECSASCTGTCEGSVSAAASCEGSCDASCQGSCEAQGGVSVSCTGTCSGNCSGTCDAAAGTNTNNTGHCDGTCKGKCDAKCEVAASAPAVKCEGKCTGKCTGSCKFAANANLKCDASCKGGCSVAYTAPRCEAKLTPPKCQGDANCQANCNASASARAECTSPSAQIAFSGDISGNVRAQAEIHSLETNLPTLALAFTTRLPGLEAQGKAVFDYSGTLVTSAGVYAKAAGCIPVIASSLSASLDPQSGSLAASFSAVTEINGAIKLGGT